MDSNKILIASYPRSGSTYLRFILASILQPKVRHTFATVNKIIPTIESDEEMRNSIADPMFYKTHGKYNFNVVFLHRHVGDCLVSEYYFQKHYYDYQGTIEQFLKAVNYGENWRSMMNHYFLAPQISFDDLVSDPVNTLFRFGFKIHDIEKAVEKLTFDSLQQQDSNFFRVGKSGQWGNLPTSVKKKLIKKNFKELKAYNYL